MTSLTAVLKRLKKVRALVLGDLVADHYLFGQTERVSREAPVLIVRHEADEVRLGGAANAAANARALGAQVSVLGVLGRDVMGREVARLFRSAGISVDSVTVAHTETKTRVLAGGVNTSRQQMLRIDKGVSGPLSTQTQRQLAQRLTRAVRDVDVVIVSDYGAGVINPLTIQALQAAAMGGTLVCVDSRFALGELTGLSVCKPNEPELAALTRLPVRTEQQLVEAANAAIARLGCETLVVTRGRNGVAVFQRGSPSHTLIPAWGNREAVDVTGAGDTVSATLALALAAGATPLEAASLANIAGAIVVQKPGTATVSPAELTAELRA